MSPYNIAIVILAAGDGKRMKSNLPKMMHILNGKPLVGHVVDNAISSGICDKPLVVVSARHTFVQDYLQEKAEYIIQREQLGTGHAIAVAEEKLAGVADSILVLYGDMPFIQSNSIKKLVVHHRQQGAVITLLGATVSDFSGSENVFNMYGRIIRDAHGAIQKIREAKDATEEELKIKEVSTGIFCFKSDWLFEHIKKLNKNNAQREYYLTDLVQMGIDGKERVESLEIDAAQAVGINSKEDLEWIKKVSNQ